MLLGLVWLIGISGFLLLLWGSKLTFFLDDWTFLVYRRGFDAEAILEPHGEHIVVAPVLVYKALLATFGMDSAFPFRVVSTGLFLLSAALLFVYMRRAIGQWPALAGVAVVLFLGAAWEDLLWPFQIGYFAAMSAGLGALLALERGEGRGDVVATVLLAVAVLFSSLALSLAIGAAVQVLLRGDRWRRLYVFVVPFALYGLWWLGWGHEAESALSFSNLAEMPRFALDGLAASIASLLGLATPGATTETGGLDWGRPLAVAALALAGWRLYAMGRVPSRLLVVVAIGASFWILAGLNQIEGREPVASRYQYVGVVFLLLVVAELLRGVRLERRRALGTIGVVLAVAAASVASNVYFLNKAYADGYAPISRLEKASLGAVEIARDTVEPGFVLTEERAGTGYVHIEAGPYLEASDEFGSPAYTPGEIAEASRPARFAADKVLFDALGIALEPSGARAPRADLRAPAGVPDGGAVEVPYDACLSVPSDGTASARLSLPEGGALIEAGDAPIETVNLGRFATGRFPIEMNEGIAAGEAAELSIPEDRATIPWTVQLQTAGDAVVCGFGALPR